MLARSNGPNSITNELGVSGATARRDLDALARQQLITRTRGGAQANAASGELPLRYRATKEDLHNRRAAEAAVDLVRTGDVIATNGGTTTTEMALELGIRSASEEAFVGDPGTVVTNAVNIAADLTVHEHVWVVVTGGVARSRSYQLVGRLGQAVLSTTVSAHGVFGRSRNCGQRGPAHPP